MGTEFVMKKFVEGWFNIRVFGAPIIFAVR